MNGKSFYYVVMLLLLVACASTAAVAWFSSSVSENTYPDNNSQVQNPELGLQDPYGDEALQGNEKDDPASSSISSKKPNLATPKPKPKPTIPKMTAPVFGNVSLAYAMDKPVFSKTFQDWRTHSGVDITAELGDAVKAVADGEVEKVSNDPRFGQIVVVNHGNNVRSIYCNLASNVPVKVGQKVKQNDVIGSVGDTAAFENVEETHLHFEITKDGKNIDPTTRITLKG